VSGRCAELGPLDPRWPHALDELPQPPPRLHLRPPADAERLERLLAPPVVAVVGTRRASAGALAFTRRLAGDLARAGACVVSGLALGIDAAAHAGALDAGGRTIAVLGCGADRDYPRANAALAARVAASGAVVSEYEPGVPPAPWRFPARNRIVAALAEAVVVVEASARSGALITAGIALELGRDVLAVPGTPWHGGHAGQNALLRDGAAPVTSVEDVLVALGLDPAAARRGDPDLRPDEARLLAAVRRAPATPETLAARVGLTPAALAAALVGLELAGAVARERDGTVVSA
jgi:DNA processing protein